MPLAALLYVQWSIWESAPPQPVSHFDAGEGGKYPPYPSPQDKFIENSQPFIRWLKTRVGGE